MSTKSREVIWGGRIMGAHIRAQGAREAAKKAAKEADKGGGEACSIRMEGYGGPAQPSPMIGQYLNGGFGWLEVECNRCKTHVSLPLDAIRRPRDTLIWSKRSFPGTLTAVATTDRVQTGASVQAVAVLGKLKGSRSVISASPAR